MNQQQLNKIDEEFEKRFTNPNKLDSRSFLHPYYQNGKIGLLLTDFKTFLHSKLQEAYELGGENRTKQIIGIVNDLLAKNNKLNENFNGGYFDEISTLKLILKKIKSLQTNKE